jgi:hypothetical protein
MADDTSAPTPVGADDKLRSTDKASFEGEYAIVEQLGHRTLVGRVAEIDRFGTRLLQIEVLLSGELLAPILIGGSSIYGFTPCSREHALARQSRRASDLPYALAGALAPLDDHGLAPRLLEWNELEGARADDDSSAR